MDDMGNAGVDAVDEEDPVPDLDLVVHDERMRIGQAELHDVAPDLGVDDPGPGLEGHLLPGDPPRRAKRAAQRPPFPHISTSEPSALKNRHLKSTLSDCSMRMRPSAPTETFRSQTRFHEGDDVPHGERPVPVVDQDEVVPASAHLIEFDHNPFLSPLIHRRREADRPQPCGKQGLRPSI